MDNFSLRQWQGIVNPNYHDSPMWWTVMDYERQTTTRFRYKPDALLFKRTVPHSQIFFHWYEDQMSQLKWDQEPMESYAELCRQRAQELRDTYDYIRLWYSGGSDSHTTLMSFVNNNIHIDEIVLLAYPDRHTDVANSTANEMFVAAIPQLKQVLPRIPNTKITTLSASEKDLDQWFNGATELNKISGFDSMDGDGGQFHFEISWGITKALNQTRHNNWCDLHGGSKARIFKKQDRWYGYWVDSCLTSFCTIDSAEDFFISRNVPKLFLKTVYNLKNYFTACNYNDSQVNNIYGDLLRHPEYNKALGRETVHLLTTFKTYTTTHNIEQYRRLSVSGVKGMQFYNNVINSDQGQRWYNNYLQTQRAVVEEYTEFWNTDAHGDPLPYWGFKGHLSKFYCLNDGLVYDSSDIGWAK
jgi:hypothetical protein